MEVYGLLLECFVWLKDDCSVIWMGWESFESGRYLRIFEMFIFEFFDSVNGRFFFMPSMVEVRMLWGGLLSHVVKVAAKFVRDVWIESEGRVSCWCGSALRRRC